mgnify:CR=1 FL=1
MLSERSMTTYRTLVHDVIYDELVQGVLSPASRAAYQAVAPSVENGLYLVPKVIE